MVLGLAGSHAKKRQICPKESHAKRVLAPQVKRNVAVRLTGTVTPIPTAAWRVLVVIRRCVDGSYTGVWKGRVAGVRTGKFNTSYTPRLAGLYVVQAKFGVKPNRIDSNKVYFGST